MDVHKSSLLAVFDAKQRLEVPLFQRQYVWNEEHQWLPLWEDIERKFIEILDGRKDAPNHFLGALVLDQKQTPTGHVVVRQVIDGQQRLITLQIFIAAYRDFCRENNCDALANECSKFALNTGMMANPDIDCFKVWPTQLDRQQFADVITSESRIELLKKYPLKRRPYARKPDPRPRMIEAYLFFYDQLKSFFLGDDESGPLYANFTIEIRLDECFQALRNSLMVVIIDLQQGDDPQVIFETLNARGEPLLPADLLKNFIFFRAGREGLDVEASYKKYWAPFDEEFWREEVKQGRLTRPRSDLFMQHFLASHEGRDIPVKHLYLEYRHWLETARPFPNTNIELATLAREGAHFRRIIAPELDDPIYELCKFLDTYDIRTAYPLLLALLEADVGRSEWENITRILESYLLRRAICDLGTKNYNRTFLSLTSNLRKEGFSAAILKDVLLGQSGESTIWPNDDAFEQAWMYKRSYSPSKSSQLVHLFSRLNQTFMSVKSEQLLFQNNPTIEHIMPQAWTENWPLSDGSKGLDFFQLIDAPKDDVQAVESRRREDAIQTLGNLTLLTSALNTAQSNLPWDQKKAAMIKHSLLPMNQSLISASIWDEAAIEKRGKELFQRAIKIWPR